MLNRVFNFSQTDKLNQCSKLPASLQTFDTDGADAPQNELQEDSIHNPQQITTDFALYS